MAKKESCFSFIMGDIIFTAKKISDQSGLATWVSDGGDMLLKAVGTVSHKGETGVDLLIGPVPDKAVETTKSKCIVHIRPKSNWKGEFGFDWYRIGDTGMKGDLRYEDILGRYYTKDPEAPDAEKNRDGNGWTAFFRKDPQPVKFATENRLSNLKAFYGWFNYTMGKDKDGKPAIKPYYYPRLALFAKVTDPATKKVTESGTADLQLLINIEEEDGKKQKPLRLEFDVEGKIADDKNEFITVVPATLPGDKLGGKETIKVTCNSVFNLDKDLKIWAVYPGKDGKEESLLAGMLKVIGPGKKKTLDVVVVSVRTGAGNGTRKSLDEFHRNLKQALIKANVIELDEKRQKVSIDVRDPEKNVDKVDFNKVYNVVGRDIGNSSGNGTNLLNFLDKQLENTYPGIYTNHFKLFFLKNTCNETEVKDKEGNTVGKSSKAGYSFLSSSHGIMFEPHSANTIGHECMHGLGLEHTFYENVFMLKAMETDNIMDYSHLVLDPVTKSARTAKDRFSSTYWQWKMTNTNLL